MFAGSMCFWLFAVFATKDVFAGSTVCWHFAVFAGFDGRDDRRTRASNFIENRPKDNAAII